MLSSGLVGAVAAMKTWRLATVKSDVVPQGRVMFVNFVALATLISDT